MRHCTAGQTVLLHTVRRSSQSIRARLCAEAVRKSVCDPVPHLRGQEADSHPSLPNAKVGGNLYAAEFKWNACDNLRWGQEEEQAQWPLSDLGEGRLSEGGWKGEPRGMKSPGLLSAPLSRGEGEAGHFPAPGLPLLPGRGGEGWNQLTYGGAPLTGRPSPEGGQASDVRSWSGPQHLGHSPCATREQDPQAGMPSLPFTAQGAGDRRFWQVFSVP